MKPSVIPLNEAYEMALELIDSHEDGCALFMMAGDLHAMNRKDRCFENNIASLANGLIGVYDLGADARRVLEDLEEFYREMECERKFR